MPKPTLYLFVGYPGAGKTTIAQIIEEQTGAVHIWADLERHKLVDQPTHATEESQRLYKILNKQTETLLAQRHSVIFDTNFNHYADRQLLRDIAAKNGADTVVIWVTTPAAVAKDRAVKAEVARNGYDFSMSEVQFDDIAAKLEPPRENEKVLKIDGTNIDSRQVSELLSL